MAAIGYDSSYTLEQAGSLGMHVHSGRRSGHRDLQLEAGRDMDPAQRFTDETQETSFLGDHALCVCRRAEPSWKEKGNVMQTACHTNGLCVLSVADRALS